MTPDLIQSIFDAWGGLTKFCEGASKVEPTSTSTAHAWLAAKQGIPRWRRSLIVQAAYSQNIALSDAMLDYLDPSRLIRQPKNYPDAPGFQKTDTSKDAADSMEGAAPLIRERVFDAISAAGNAGMTADECAYRLKETPFSIRPRFTELKVKGKIKDSGERRKNRSGRRAAVFVAA